MGWPWSSSTPTAPTATAPDPPSSTLSQSQLTSQTQDALPPPNTTPTAEELADRELQSFLAEIGADLTPKTDTQASSTKYTRLPRSFPSSTISRSTTDPTSTSTQQHNNTPSAITSPGASLSEQLLPTTMSCRDAFDAAFYCNSFGGRFNDLYRYGNLKSCSETWSDFWFCMRTRTQGSPAKEMAIKEHYRQKEEQKYSRKLGKESSEDIWRSRERKLEWGEAFNVEFQEFKGTDEEWRAAQREWRARERGRGGKEDGVD